MKTVQLVTQPTLAQAIFGVVGEGKHKTTFHLRFCPSTFSGCSLPHTAYARGLGAQGTTAASELTCSLSPLSPWHAQALHKASSLPSLSWLDCLGLAED